MSARSEGSARKRLLRDSHFDDGKGQHWLGRLRLHTSLPVAAVAVRAEQREEPVGDSSFVMAVRGSEVSLGGDTPHW